MTIYNGDQQGTTPMIVRGMHVNATAAVVAAALPAATAFQFTSDYAHLGVHYRRGQVYSLTAAVKTSMLALGAPMVAVN